MISAGPAVLGHGRTNDQPVHIVDLFPTMLELCDINPTAAGRPLDGKRLATRSTAGVTQPKRVRLN